MKSISAFLAAAFLFAAPLFADDSYTLVFHRPMKVGQRFTFAAKASFKEANTMTANDAPLRNDVKSADCKLSGELEIVAITPKGRAREVRLKLTQAEATEDGKAAEPFRPGDEIHVVRDGKKTVAEVGGKAATPLQAKLLDVLNVVQVDLATTDDDIFGPGRKVKTGEQWPVHSEVAAADPDLKSLGPIKGENITGTTRLIGPVRSGDQPCLKVHGEMKVVTSGAMLPGLPPQVKVRSMTMTMSGDADLPIDPSAARSLDGVLMTVNMEGGGTIEKDGKATKLDFKSNIQRSKEMRLTPVK